jgi:cyclic beta-1,2-glucan synthetase
VAVPAIVATPEHAHHLLVRLAWLAREHDDPNVRFALLADFADATTSTTSSDADILREEQRLVEQINADLRDEAGDRVCVLHRERTWLAADRTWIGWERKRGKVLELLRLLVGRADTSYRWMFGDLAHRLDAGAFPYIFVLDESNWLTREDMLSVLRVAAHPANRAQLDADGGRLDHGYAIFQPAIVHSIPRPTSGDGDAADASSPALPPVASPRFHFDVLDVGVFEGKGLLDVRACHALLDDVFPPGVVLQHDPLEGFVARTAEIRDAFVLDALAPGYLQQIQRGHRWLRGYVQLLPWVLPRVRGSDGGRRANPVPRIHRLVILEWILIELARPASLVLLVAGWMTLRAHAAVWTVLVCPPLALLLARMIGSALTYLTIVSHRASRPRVSRGRLLRSLHASGVAWFATVFSQAMLPYESMVVLDAFCRAAWRMLVSRRHLLDWRPVSRVQQGVWLRARREYRHVSWVCCATAVSTLAGVVATRPGHLLLALPFAAAWIGAPKLVAWLDGALDAPMTPPAPPAARQTDLVTASGAA